MPVGFCLDCDHQIEVGRGSKVGQHVKCPYCEAKLEIINTDPLKLDWAYDGPVTKFNPFDEGSKPPATRPRWA